MAKHLGALAGLVLASCIAPTEVELSGDAIAIAVVVSDGPEMPIVSASAASNGTLGVSVPTGHSLWIVEVPTERLLDLRGDPLPESSLSSVRARLLGATSPNDGCGCPVPDFDTHKIVVRGESCAPPRFSTVRRVNNGALEPVEDAGALDQIRAEVRIDWPGPCEIDRPSDVEPSELGAPELVHEPDGWPFERAWQTSAGTIGLFSRAKTLLLHAARESIEIDDAFRGQVRAVAPLSDDSFIVFSRTALGADKRRYEATRVNSDGRRQALTVRVSRAEFADPPVRAVVARDSQKPFFSAGDDDLVFLAAQSKSDGASVYACTIGSGTIVSCEQLNQPGTLSAVRFNDVAFTRENSFVAVDFRDLGMGVRDDNGDWRRLLVEAQDPSVVLNRAEWIDENHVLVCGHQNESGYAKSAELTRSDLLGGIAPQWTTLLSASSPGAPRGVCSGFSRPADRPGVLRMYTSDARYFDVATTGIVGEGAIEPNPEGPVGMQWVEESSLNQLLVVDARGGLWTSATGTIAFSQLYGPEPPYFHQSASALVDDRLLTVGLRNDALTIRALPLDGDVPSWIPTTARGRVRVMAAAWDSLRGEALVSGLDAPLPGTAPAPWLERLRPDAPLAERIGSELDSPGRVREIAEVRPGVHIGLTDAWGIWRIEGESIEAVPVEWDDPDTEVRDRDGAQLTADVARQKRSDPCNLRFAHQPWPTSGALGEVETSWTGASVSHGVVWLVGCSGAVARIVTSEEPWKAQRIAFPERPQSFFWGAPPHLDAVHALAPDVVLIGGAGSNEVYEEIGYTWILRGDGAGFVFEELDRDSPPRNSVNLPSSDPLKLVGVNQHVVMVFQRGAVLPIYGDTIHNLRTTMTDAHRTPNDELLLVDDARAYLMRFTE